MSGLDRRCNGGPDAAAWCGRPAELVAHREDGLGWFCCRDHTDGVGTRPGTTLEGLVEFLERVDRETRERDAADEVVRILASWKSDG